MTLGNICRSPMAEAVFAYTVKQHNLEDKITKIDSAGTASYHVKIENLACLVITETDM
jgi:low molecular weight phosphotyrosine protein phosphatase